MEYLEKLFLGNCLWTRWNEILQVFCKVTTQNIMLTLKNTECKQINIIFCIDYQKLMEMHCFLYRQMQNIVCKITNLCGTIYSNTFPLCTQKMSLRDKLCAVSHCAWLRSEKHMVKCRTEHRLRLLISHL